MTPKALFFFFSPFFYFYLTNYMLVILIMSCFVTSHISLILSLSITDVYIYVQSFSWVCMHLLKHWHCWHLDLMLAVSRCTIKLLYLGFILISISFFILHSSYFLLKPKSFLNNILFRNRLGLKPKPSLKKAIRVCKW